MSGFLSTEVDFKKVSAGKNLLIALFDIVKIRFVSESVSFYPRSPAVEIPGSAYVVAETG